jgi:hypothetical protein
MHGENDEQHKISIGKPEVKRHFADETVSEPRKPR